MPAVDKKISAHEEFLPSIFLLISTFFYRELPYNTNDINHLGIDH
jgi:hypothetical protein